MLKRNEPKVFNELGCAAYDVALTAGVTLPEATGPVPLRKCLKAFSNPETVRAKVQSKKLAVGLASVAHAEADPVGLAIASATPMVLTPRARRSVVLEMIRALDVITPAGPCAIAPLVASARASRVVVISDLLGDLNDMVTAARLRIATRTEMIVLHIVADEELNPPKRGVLAVDPEHAGLRRMLDGPLCAEYRVAYSRWIDDTAALLRAAGVRYLRALTSEKAPHVVRRLVGETARRGA